MCQINYVSNCLLNPSAIDYHNKAAHNKTDQRTGSNVGGTIFSGDTFTSRSVSPHGDLASFINYTYMAEVVCLLTKAPSLLERLLWSVPIGYTHVLSCRTHRPTWYKNLSTSTLLPVWNTPTHTTAGKGDTSS